MHALWDRYPELPFSAVAPWPQIIYNGQVDWIASVDHVETWLSTHVGLHWVHWCWSMSSTADPYMCAVAFARNTDSTLFLLQFGE